MMTNSIKTEMYNKVFYPTMESLNITDADISEGAGFVCDFMRDNPLTDENRSIYMMMLAVAAYNAGKKKAE